MKETVLQNFIINKMTQEQYDFALKSGDIKDNELYLTDLSSSSGGDITDATETSKGVARLSTQEEAIQGYDDETIMTPLKTNIVTESKVGKLYQIGYTGTLEGGVLTFEQPSSEEPYDLKFGYEYLVDLLFEAVGEIDDSIKVIIKNKGNIINLVNVLHDDTVNSITVGDLKQIMKYSSDIGWRWLFKAWYTETQAGAKVLVMPSTVVDTISEDTDNTFTGVNTFKGDNHPVVIEGMAGTTASGLQIKDSLGAGETDVEHYRSGDMYVSRLLNRNKIADKDSYIDLYTTDVGVSVLDESMVDSVLVPTPDSDDNTKRAVNTEWANNNLVHKTGNNQITLTNGNYNTRIVQQDDGNFVIYKNGKAIIACHNEEILTAPNNANTTTTHSVVTTTGISKSSNAIGLKLGNGIIINSLVMNSQGTTYTWKIPFTTTEYVVVTTSCSGLKNFTRTTTTISCNDFHHGETSKPSDVMAIAIGY